MGGLESLQGGWGLLGHFLHWLFPNVWIHGPRYDFKSICRWCMLGALDSHPSFPSHRPHGDGSCYPSHEERDDWRSVPCSQAVPVDAFLHSFHSRLWGTTWTIDCSVNMVGYSIYPLVVNKRPQNMAHYILLVTWHMNAHFFSPWLIKNSSHFHFLQAWELYYITLNCIDRSIICFPVNCSEISFICMFLCNILQHKCVCVWEFYCHASCMHPSVLQQWSSYWAIKIWSNAYSTAFAVK